MYLNEATLLSNLRLRYKKNLIYVSFNIISTLTKLSVHIYDIGVICDPFYRNETLLYKTSNGDMAEILVRVIFFYFEIFAYS